MFEVHGVGLLEYGRADGKQLPFDRVEVDGQLLLRCHMMLYVKSDRVKLSIEGVAVERLTLNRDGEATVIEQQNIGWTREDKPTVKDLRLLPNLRYALREVLHQFEEIGSIGYSCGYDIDRRGHIYLELVAADQKAAVANPCVFAHMLANALSRAVQNNEMTRFFARVHGVLVEHLGVSDHHRYRDPFLQLQPVGEMLIPGGPGGWMRFYVDDDCSRFRVACDPEHQEQFEAVINSTNESLRPLAAEWFGH